MQETTGCFQVQSAGREDLNLGMQSLWLTGKVAPTGARLRVRHEFQYEGRNPVEAVYCFTLPRDAAMRRFRIETAEMSAHSELRPTKEAVAEYERGLAEGSLSAMARQYGDGLVNLSVGNIRPQEVVVVELEIIAGVELRDDGLRLRFPFTVAPCYHPQMVVSAPEPGWSEMELPAGEFGDLLLPRWAANSKGLHRTGFDLELEMGARIEKLGSPSHRIQVEGKRVALATNGDLPNRDLVLDVGMEARARVMAGAAPDGRSHFTAVIPSTEFGPASGSRAIVLVIDTSGSMEGSPIEQAKSAALACLGALEPEDRFGLLTFSSTTKVWQQQPRPATKEWRNRAAEFLRGCDAAGGTELARALGEVGKICGPGESEVLLMTDGEVFGGEHVMEEARRSKLRVHVLGIGAASQDRFLGLLARETGGVSRFVTPAERVDAAALELFSAAGRPVASEVSVSVEGTVLVEPAERVYAGTPVIAMGMLANGTGEATLHLSSSAGERGYPMVSGGGQNGELLWLMEGARRITDLDARMGASDGPREEGRIRQALLRLSQEYGLASREMSLVAVMERKGDVAGRVPKTVVVPVGLVEDVQYCMVGACPPPAPCGEPRFAMRVDQRVNTVRPAMALAAMLEDDGGMPGDTLEERILASIRALSVMLRHGKAFALHAKRLRDFLKKQTLNAEAEQLLCEVEAGTRYWGVRFTTP